MFATNTVMRRHHQATLSRWRNAGDRISTVEESSGELSGEALTAGASRIEQQLSESSETFLKNARQRSAE